MSVQTPFPRPASALALVREGLMTAAPRFAQAKTQDAVRLDRNEALFPMSEEMKKRIGEVTMDVALAGYPDGSCAALREAAALHFGVRRSDAMSVGNGADDLVGRLCAAFGRPRQGQTVGRVLVPEMSFEAYRMAATAHGLETHTFDFEPNLEPDLVALEAALKAVRPNLVFLATPNNPTGSVVDPDAMKAVMVRHPEVLFVLDEAYIEYASVRSLANEVVDLGNAVCLSSLSKLGLAGLRLGFVSAHPDLIRVMDAARMPFPVNALSQAVGTMLLTEFGDELRASVEAAVAERGRVNAAVQLCIDKTSVTVVEGEGNFLSLLTKDAKALHAGLLEQGVVVRQFFHKDPDHVLNRLLRISVGSVEQNERLLSAMARPKRHQPLCLPLLEGTAL